jgi:hypothetical protein
MLMDVLVACLASAPYRCPTLSVVSLEISFARTYEDGEGKEARQDQTKTVTDVIKLIAVISPGKPRISMYGSTRI